MDAESLLTDALRLSILDTVSDVYANMLQSCLDADSATHVEVEILNTVKYTLAESHRLRNARRSLQHRIPDEIWCHIWALLPFPGRMAITRTCHAWRLTALACPKLWQAVTFYTSRHASHCFCDDCADPRGPCHTHPTGWDLSPYDADATNVYWASDILARSCSLPLDLRLVIVPFCADSWPLRDLATALAEHASRLTTLRICSADFSAAQQFLSGFRSLPSLKVMVTAELENDKGLTEEVPLFPPDLDLPALSSLGMDHGFTWARDGRQFVTLRVLSIRLLCDPEEELLPALAACPHLESLLVDFYRLGSRTEFKLSLPESHICPGALSSVTLISLAPNLAEWALAVLQSPMCANVAIKLKSGHRDIATTAAVFSDLAGTVHLHFVEHFGSLLLEGRDESGRVRRVVYNRKVDPASLLMDIPRLSIVSRAVTKLTVSAYFLDELASVWPSAPSVTDLEITLNDEDLEDLGEEALGPTPQFTGVRAVSLLGDECTRVISAQDVSGLLHRLTLQLPLATLKIDHRIFEGSSSNLGTFAQSVVVGVCHV